MARPVVVVLMIAQPSSRAEAVSDPLHFLKRHFAEFEAGAERSLRQMGRLPVAKGSDWGLLLPGDGDVSTVRETYGEELADTLAQARMEEPDLPIAWKVVECVLIGTDGANQMWLEGWRPK